MQRETIDADPANALGHLTQHAIGDREAAHLAWRQALDIFEELSHTDAEQVRAKLGEADGSH